MADQEVLEYFNLGNKTRVRVTDKQINNLSNEMRAYLESRFSEYSTNDKITEAVYRIYYKMESLPHCQICGKPLNYKVLHHKPYSKTCSKVCQNKLNSLKQIGRKRSPETDAKIRKTMLERYGVENCTQCPEILKRRTQTNIERFGGASPACRQDVREKMFQTNLERYGHRCSLGSDTIREKVKATNLERYGVENVFASEEIKERILKTNHERYGVDNWKQSDEGRKQAKEMFKDGTVKAKEIATKKKNGTLNSSKQEDCLYSILKELYPEYTILREYKEERYPFYCDFYIKELDVFIELNLHYTHGSHPFDPNSAKDLERLVKYSKYRYMIDVWTCRDPNKIEAAEFNDLRYIRVYDPKFAKDSISQSIRMASYGAPCRVLLLPEAKH